MKSVDMESQFSVIQEKWVNKWEFIVGAAVAQGCSVMCCTLLCIVYIFSLTALPNTFLQHVLKFGTVQGKLRGVATQKQSSVIQNKKNLHIFS